MLDEIRSGHSTCFLVEGMGDDQIWTKIEYKFGTLLRCRQIVAFLNLLEHLVGMGEKRQYCCLTSATVRPFHQAIDQLLVALVHAVKDANSRD